MQIIKQINIPEPKTITRQRFVDCDHEYLRNCGASRVDRWKKIGDGNNGGNTDGNFSASSSSVRNMAIYFKELVDVPLFRDKNSRMGPSIR